MAGYVLPLAELGLDDLPRVGGKNASLGEMIGALSRAGVRVPDGFALSVDAFHAHLRGAGIEAEVHAALEAFDPRDIPALARTAAEVRRRVADAPLPEALAAEARAAYAELSRRYGEAETDVAVRSSATAEDLPTASFAGQQ